MYKNKKNNSIQKKRGGYSLIEISIVLTIIAFIIAGTIGGKALLDASKVNVLVSEANTIKIAMKAYMEDLGIANVGWNKDNYTKFNPKYFINAYLKSDKSTEELECFPSKVNGCWVLGIDSFDSYNYLPGAMLGDITVQDLMNAGTIDTSLCLKFANKISDSRFKVIKKNESKIIDIPDKQSIGVVCTGIFNDIGKLDEEEIDEGTYLDEITTIKHQKSVLTLYLFDVF